MGKYKTRNNSTAETMMEGRKKGKWQRKEMKGRVGDNQKIKPKLLDAIRKKQREMLGKTDDKLNTPTDLPNFDGKKIDAKTRSRMNAPENQFNSYNPLHEDRKTYEKMMKKARGLKAKEQLPIIRKANKIYSELPDEDKK